MRHMVFNLCVASDQVFVSLIQEIGFTSSADEDLLVLIRHRYGSFLADDYRVWTIVAHFRPCLLISHIFK